MKKIIQNALILSLIVSISYAPVISADEKTEGPLNKPIFSVGKGDGHNPYVLTYLRNTKILLEILKEMPYGLRKEYGLPENLEKMFSLIKEKKIRYIALESLKVDEQETLIDIYCSKKVTVTGLLKIIKNIESRINGVDLKTKKQYNLNKQSLQHAINRLNTMVELCKSIDKDILCQKYVTENLLEKLFGKEHPSTYILLKLTFKKIETIPGTDIMSLILKFHGSHPLAINYKDFLGQGPTIFISTSMMKEIIRPQGYKGLILGIFDEYLEITGLSQSSHQTYHIIQQFAEYLDNYISIKREKTGKVSWSYIPSAKGKLKEEIIKAQIKHQKIGKIEKINAPKTIKGPVVWKTKKDTIQSLYILNHDIVIENNSFLVIREGVNVNGMGHTIKIKKGGALFIQGKSHKRVILKNVNFFLQRYSRAGSSKNVLSKITINKALIENGQIEVELPLYAYKLTIKNSILKNMKSMKLLGSFGGVTIKNNHFTNCMGTIIQYAGYLNQRKSDPIKKKIKFLNNHFSRTAKDHKGRFYVIFSKDGYNGVGQIVVKNNNFSSDYTVLYQGNYYTNKKGSSFIVENNYWNQGMTEEEIIDGQLIFPANEIKVSPRLDK